MFYIFINTILLLYVVLIVIWIFKLFNSGNRVLDSKLNQIKVTVIIPVRNESNSIENCLSSLLKLKFDPGKLEFIISDDHSEDDTVLKCRNWQNKFSDKDYSLTIIGADKNDKTGKKSALERAIKVAEGDIIITSDADCTFESEWVEDHLEQYRNPDINMVCGTVTINPEKKYFDYFQSVEQSVLNAISIGSLRMGFPLMCNGANISFRKEKFEAVGGYSYGRELPGGDDVFLMLSMNKSYPGSIRYIDSQVSNVDTEAKSSFNSYLEQRLRHGSKVLTYDEAYVKMIGGILFISNIIVLFSCLLFIFQWISVSYLGSILAVKFGMDIIFGFTALMKFKQRNLLPYLVFVMILYPFINAFIGISVIFKKKFTWKGRYVS